MKAMLGGFACLAILLSAGAAGQAQDNKMSFFVTSAGPGDGGNLGGLDGADAQCQTLANAAGAADQTWRAYLSASGVNARDRIGSGPWHNAKGELIAGSVDELHSDANKISKQTGLTETGAAMNGRGDTPNTHDILTGSNADGTLAAGMTCEDWTSNSSAARALSVITTASGSRTMRRRNRGTPRIPRAAAPRRICRSPAATGCSTASPRTERG